MIWLFTKWWQESWGPGTPDLPAPRARWVGRTMHEIKDSLPEQWQSTLQESGQILQELPVEGRRHLHELWKQIDEPRSGRDQPNSPVDKLRDLLIRLSNHWENYRIFDWQPEVPWTNNTTEQVIERMKMRSQTVHAATRRKPGC